MACSAEYVLYSAVHSALDSARCTVKYIVHGKVEQGNVLVSHLEENKVEKSKEEERR
jgi:hypothetical protein